MKVRENPSLRSLNTFGLDATARLLLEIETEEDLLTAPALDPDRDLVLGGGSNVVLVDDVPGTIFLNRIRGIEAVGERPAVTAETPSGASTVIENRRSATAKEGYHPAPESRKVPFSPTMPVTPNPGLSVLAGNSGALSRK